MADIGCSHCNEPWDVYGLRTDSIGYLSPGDGDMLTEVESVAVVLAYLERAGGSTDHTLRATLDHLARTELSDPLTVPDLFEWWWDSDTETPEARAAKRIVDTAIYRAVRDGKGCTECGFDHTGPGRYRQQTLQTLVFDSVTDDDPAEYLDL